MKAWRGKNVIFACALAGVAAIASASFVEPSVRVVYNASDSEPRGWYRITPVRRLTVDSVVLANLPNRISALAGERGYLPTGVPILKRVGAMAPQQVCIRDGTVRVDGVAVAHARTFDGLGRLLFAWEQCRRLDNDELFLLGTTNPASFDSRYFGPIRVGAVLGSAQPLWIW